MPAAATHLPSGEMATATIGALDAFTEARVSPCGERK